jgi:hypothetical protein
MNRSARSASPERFQDTPRNGCADLALLLILALAAVLRSIKLGALGYWIDEDLTWLAVRGIQEHGVPLLPSGVVYDRAFPYSYLVAAFASLFGATPEGLRLPSLISSLGTIVFVYLLARDLAGRPAGFLAALLLAVSPWEHHYARMARMYAPFVLLVSASLFFALRSLVTGSRAAWLAACVLVLIAVPLHDLGSTLILIFLVPMLYPAPRRPPLRWTAGGAVAVILGMAVERIATSLPPMQERADLQLVQDIGTEAARITLPLLPEITLNHARWILFDLWTASPLAASTGILGLAAAAMGMVGFLRRTRSSARPRFERIALGGMALLLFLALVFNQLVLAGLFALALLTLLGPDALPVRRSLLSLGLIVSAAVAGLLLGQAIAHGPAGLADRSFLRLFFSIPVPFYRLMLEQHPISVLILLLGSGLLFPPFLRGDDPRVITLFGFLLASLLLMGLFRSPYVIHRYTYYLNPAFVTLLVICAREIGLAAARLPDPAYRRVVALGIGIGLVVATEQFDPAQSWAASHRGYGYERDLLSDPDLVSHFYADYGSCARFVLADRRPGDIAMAKEPVEIYPYGLHCDLRVNALYGVYALAPSATQPGRNDSAGNSAAGSDPKVPVDWYLGIPILSNRLDLETAIDQANAGGHSVYVIYTRPDPRGPAVHLPEDVLELLAENDHRIVHTGADGLTVVLRFRPS